jgi:uncharacterized protein
MKKSILTIVACIITLLVSAQSIDTLTLTINGASIHSVLSQPATKGDIPLAIFIAGSGPTDMNGNNPMMKNNSTKLLSEAMVSQNIATLRFDKYGIAQNADPNFDDMHRIQIPIFRLTRNFQKL